VRGVPVIRVLRQGMAADRVESLHGIVNAPRTTS